MNQDSDIVSIRNYVTNLIACVFDFKSHINIKTVHFSKLNARDKQS